VKYRQDAARVEGRCGILVAPTRCFARRPSFTSYALERAVGYPGLAPTLTPSHVIHFLMAVDNVEFISTSPCEKRVVLFEKPNES
jgi:hypothetical protein